MESIFCCESLQNTESGKVHVKVDWQQKFAHILFPCEGRPLTRKNDTKSRMLAGRVHFYFSRSLRSSHERRRLPLAESSLLAVAVSAADRVAGRRRSNISAFQKKIVFGRSTPRSTPTPNPMRQIPKFGSETPVPPQLQKDPAESGLCGVTCTRRGAHVDKQGSSGGDSAKTGAAQDVQTVYRHFSSSRRRICRNGKPRAPKHQDPSVRGRRRRRSHSAR